MPSAGTGKHSRLLTSVVRRAIAGLGLALLPTVPAWAAEPGSWFLGAAAGWQGFDSSLHVNEGTVDLLFEPEDEGDTLGLRLGYAFNDHWFSTVEYHRVDADDTDIDNWYLSINRRWRLSPGWSWSLGLLAGGSTLDWQDAPIDTLNRDRESDDLLWGMQTGLAVDLGERWLLELRYQYLAPEHNTRLRPVTGSGQYTHESFHHVAIGLDFHF